MSQESHEQTFGDHLWIVDDPFWIRFFQYAIIVPSGGRHYLLWDGRLLLFDPTCGPARGNVDEWKWKKKHFASIR